MDFLNIEYLLIKKEDDFCKSVRGFNNLLKTDINIKIEKGSITYKRKKFSYKVSTNKITDKSTAERSFNILLSKKIKSKSAIEKEIEDITELKRAILKVLPIDKIKVSILWDDISNHYSINAYPLLNELENLLRKLILKFMLTNMGTDWLDNATPKEVKENIVQRAKQNNLRFLFQNALFEADFIHLNGFLFKPYSTLSTDQLSTIIETTENIEDLDLEVIKSFVPKSNWDRYFSKLIKFQSLEKKWEQLYELRNKVAHNKPIDKGDFEELKRLHLEITDKLNKAIEKLDELSITDEEKEDVTKQAVSDFITGGTKSYLGYSSGATTNSFLNLPCTCSVCGKSFNEDVAAFNPDRKCPDCQKASPWNLYLIMDNKCSKCGKVFKKDPTRVSFTNECPECENSGLYPLGYSPSKVCSSCGKSYNDEPGTISFSNKCPECQISQL